MTDLEYLAENLWVECETCKAVKDKEGWGQGCPTCHGTGKAWPFRQRLPDITMTSHRDPVTHEYWQPRVLDLEGIMDAAERVWPDALWEFFHPVDGGYSVELMRESMDIHPSGESVKPTRRDAAMAALRAAWEAR